MRQLKRLVGLTNCERCLLARAFMVVGITRVALWILPVDGVRRVATKAAGLGSYPVPVDRSAWAVHVVSRYVPGATCLTQALAVQALLISSGYASRVEIGVAREAGKLEAHAWVICDGQIVVGGPEVKRYLRLATWDR